MPPRHHHPKQQRDQTRARHDVVAGDVRQHQHGVIESPARGVEGRERQSSASLERRRRPPQSSRARSGLRLRLLSPGSKPLPLQRNAHARDQALRQRRSSGIDSPPRQCRLFGSLSRRRRKTRHMLTPPWNGSTTTTCSTSGSSPSRAASSARARSCASRTRRSAARSIGSRTSSARSCSCDGGGTWCSRSRAASRFVTPTRSSRWGASSSTPSRGARAASRCASSVGVADVLPPSLVRRFLEPAFRLGSPSSSICRADKSVRGVPRRARAARARRRARRRPRRARHRRCARSAIRWANAARRSSPPPRLAAALRRGFPRSLDGAPFLLPGAPSDGPARARAVVREPKASGPRSSPSSTTARSPRTSARTGMGVFAAPTVIEAETRRRYDVRVVGRSEAVRQQFYAISVERRSSTRRWRRSARSARQDIFPASRAARAGG